MTAYVVLKMAQNDPDLLNDVVVFSTAADKTPGSSSRIRAGESLPAGELLYALLLPSGNDAAIALAEHFGRRLLSATDANQKTTPLSRFITEMNRAANDHKMHNTHFKNPHGLTEKGHLSTAHDLLKLAHTAMQLPEFRKRVASRQRGSTVSGPGGYHRNMLWKNTNRLLTIDGYQGVKTGTTSAAGACLVSMGQRGADAMFVVVLGSSSSASRYTDTRNLFRWAWQQHIHP
jgi:D-alanyl-D-alanine carboxypeptidase (penicillin-binding protein 5/6)